MPKSFQTSGMQGVDREFDMLWQQVAHLKNGASAVAAVAPAVTSVTTVTQAEVTLQNTSASTSLLAATVVVDDAAGLSIAATGAPNTAKISRTATTTVPGAIAASGSAGSSTKAANADHTHAGLVTNDIAVVTADPGSPRTGQIWFRSDTGMLSLYTGSATKRVTMA